MMSYCIEPPDDFVKLQEAINKVGNWSSANSIQQPYTCMVMQYFSCIFLWLGPTLIMWHLSGLLT